MPTSTSNSQRPAADPTQPTTFIPAPARGLERRILRGLLYVAFAVGTLAILQHTTATAENVGTIVATVALAGLAASARD